MKFLDLLIMSVNNLRRRKLRTALTVLGVIIGTSAIVVMVSLGIGLKELNMELYQSYGSLNAISVSTGGRYDEATATSKETEPTHLTDETVKLFEGMEYVDMVSPVLDVEVAMKQGIYSLDYARLTGASRAYLEQIKLGEGKLWDANSKELQLIVGNMVKQQFRNAKTNKGFWDTGEVPNIDFINKPMFVIFDLEAYHQSQNGDSGEAAPKKAPKKYIVPTAAVVAGGPDEWNQYSYNIYTDIDALKTQLRRVFKKNPIPGQPTNKKGKAYNYFIYNEIIVFADDMSHVMDLQKRIIDMGYQANSQMEWIEQSQKQSNMIQGVLGGIGAVSLFVAAIGIANTMMMSIYERTKEIGVMKVLGCDMGNIRNMFLLESAFIGFLGGIIGILLSFGISYLINRFLGAMFATGMEGNISRIPMWLSMTSVSFAIFVGMAAGFFPAMRAMKLSPLAAIRND